MLGPNFNPTVPPTRPNGQRHPSSTGSDTSTVGSFFPPSNSATYPVYSSTQPTVVTLPEGMPFSTQTSPVSPSFQNPAGTPIGGGGMPLPQVSGDMNTSFTASLFDPSNPAIFNFNLEGLNFGSHYAAMEFGMLNHLSSAGGGDGSNRDPSLSQPGPGGVGYGASGTYGNGVGQQQMYDGGMMGGGGAELYGLDPSANGLYAAGNLQHGLPHAYAIAAGPTGLQSPSTETNSPQPTNYAFEGSPTTASYAASGASSSQAIAPPPPPPKPKPKPISSLLFPQSLLGKRQRDSSFIYDAVKEPYTYVRGFHRLIALVKRRFSPGKTLRIAKSLSSIRPSFIACTKTLNRQDLIFMEKSLQRTLFQLEDYMVQGSSPAIVCRRTGEVVAVNKEFTALTGWTKEVLLGHEPNCNINMGGQPPPAAAGEDPGRSSLVTPRLDSINAEAAKAAEGKPQPVFICELMDDDSVVEFYEDYAHLAFGDSRGSVRRKCKLLKYRTQEMVDGSGAVDTSPQHGRGAGVLGRGVAVIDSAHGISKIAKGGKLECSYCWHIRADTFDIPMLIVMNVSPSSSPGEKFESRSFLRPVLADARVDSFSPATTPTRSRTSWPCEIKLFCSF